MAIKPHKNLNDLIRVLDNRKLKLNEKTEKILKEINYFQLINGIENLLLPIDKQLNYGKKEFKTESIEDFIAIYEFDRELSNQLLNIISKFEMRLKTSIAHNFAKIYCNGINNTMEYTNKNNYEDISSDSSYPFRSYSGDNLKYQNEHICNDFNNFKLFKRNFLDKLVKNNDFIDKTFYRSENYRPNNPSDVALYHDDDRVAVPIWVAIQTFDLGCLKRMCHYLKRGVLNLVLADFGISTYEKHIFFNMLDIIHQLRNSCAHFSLLFRFKTASNIGLGEGLINKFNLTPKKRTHPATGINLFDSLKILGFFEDISSLMKPIKKIIYRNNRKFKSTYYDLNNRLLTEMGNPIYSEWKKMLKNN